MTTIILGLSGAPNQDPAAAVLVDGELVAAAEEERFLREKHAPGRMPLAAARFCLKQAGIRPHQVDQVAFPYAPIPLLTSRARWHYARRHWYAGERSVAALLNGNRRFRRHRRRVHALCDELGINWRSIRFRPVEHQLAHASSAYHLSGFQGKTAILGVDTKGEYATTFFGWGEAGKIHKIREFHAPDSLGGVCAAMAEYLGFDVTGGESKVMGMAPYGNPELHDFSRLMQVRRGRLRVNTRYVNTVGVRRYKEDSKGFSFSPKLVEWLGPRRRGDIADQPYVDYAASMQRLFEDLVVELVQHHLGKVLEETGQLCFAGIGALNPKLNQCLLQMPQVQELFVQPAAGDCGTAVGAATWVAADMGLPVSPLHSVQLGPGYSMANCEDAVVDHCMPCVTRVLHDVPNQTADLLAAGHPVGWFQGRMEFGPRALGGRCILGCASEPGMAERLNKQIKFREHWRPFSPSISDRVAKEVIGTDHPAPFMTVAFAIAESWHQRIPEVVHQDGSARVHVVTQEANPRYHALLDAMADRTGNAVVLNTSLNRRGEPMVCSPRDALNMFFSSDLRFLVLEDLLVAKTADDLPEGLR